MKESSTEVIGSAVVIGGGIGAMQTSLDLAEMGIKVYMVEAASAIGGRMTQLDKTFPTNECSMCIVSPKLVDCGRHLNIDIITGAEIESVAGEAGNFEITLLKKARYVDTDKCTGCNECALVCPVEIPSTFDSSISNQRAIYRLYPQAVPHAFVIEKENRAPCVARCPAHINIQGYVALISQGKYREAFDLIKQRVPFPGVLGRVCYHPCEGDCNRKDMESPLAINPLKRFVSDFVYNDKKSEVFPVDAVEDEEVTAEPGDGSTVVEVETITAEPGNGTPVVKVDGIATAPDKTSSVVGLKTDDEATLLRKGKKVAVVGAGPCGMTAAGDLAQLGYSVTIFEKETKLGGLLTFGIPAYRLPRDIIDREVKEILSLGVEAKTGVTLGNEIDFSKLKKDGYEAILVATGASTGRRLAIPGIELKNVWQGIDFLKEVNTDKNFKLQGKLLVIGGGNVAIDVARAAVRIGMEDVTLVCLESKDEMPAYDWEIDLAEDEEIRVCPSLGCLEVNGKDGAVTGMQFVECTSVFDADGAFNPVYNEDNKSAMDADHVIVAIGQYSDTSYLQKTPKIEKTGFGGIKVDPLTLESTQEGIFAGGEVASGPSSVIEAIAAGKEAAISIDRYLQGQDLKDNRTFFDESAGIPERAFPKQERVTVPLLPAEERKSNFNEVEITLSEEDAVREATRCLNCGICSECMECVKACEANAIDHFMTDERITINAGAIIATPGVGLFDANDKAEYGYDRYDNVITSIQFERILSTSGPTKGEILRPSDGERPKKVAFVQCVGSRDPSCGNEFCSSICCMATMKEAIMAKEHDPDIESTIFYIDIRSFGKDFDEYYESAKKTEGISFVRCMISKVYERPKSKNLIVKYIDEKGDMEESEFDLIILAVGLTDTTKMRTLAGRLGIDVNEYGFGKTERTAPGRTSREGIFIAGPFAEPKDIPETVAEGSSAAALASALLKDARGTLVRKKEYPPERDVTGEDLRIGVFVCRCGKNIGSVVDVPDVVEAASALGNVVFASESLYTCSQDALENIKKSIAEHNLNRVVVASCTPRTHEDLFRDTVQETGLNRYLFEMTSLREQIAWVHRGDHAKATEKAKSLVDMVVAKVRHAKALSTDRTDINSKALIIGGGAAGMQAALSIADQGFDVYLVEKTESLGGHLSHIYSSLEGVDTQLFLQDLIEKVNAHEKVEVMTSARVTDFSGFVGNYHSTIESENGHGDVEIDHGVVVVAIGGATYEPPKGEYGYGDSSQVLNQVTLEEKLAHNPDEFKEPQKFVMIQCVGSRSEESPWCSRVCCSEAIKNALKLKSIDPRHEITVLYRDIRTYGFIEKYYFKAREAGVVFSHFDAEKAPAVSIENNSLHVKHFDTLLGEEVDFEPHWLVLSTGISPGEENENLAKTLKVPLDANKFFLEAHAKIRPLDFTAEGIFFCGLSHSPRFLHEALMQAQGAAARAVTILSKDSIEAKAITATVNERVCKACGLCVTACPYHAREMDEETNVAQVIETLCQGCGACVVTCPSGATKHRGFDKKQIMAMVDQAL